MDESRDAVDVFHTILGIEFGWRSDKARKNLLDHKVSFKYATEVFFDPLRRDLRDNRYDYDGETRFRIVGRTNRGDLLLVGYEEYGDCNWIIHARKLKQNEARRIFEERF